MANCKACGGTCTPIGGGMLRCDFCGSTFSSAEMAPPAPKSVAAEHGDVGADLFEKNINGVLEIRVQLQNGYSSGSGYLVSSTGLAVTNAHVVALQNGASCGKCTVKLAGETVGATVVAMGTQSNSGHCSNNDLALIRLDRVPYSAKVLKFGDYARVRTGQKVFVIGNSLGRGTCITSGIVSDKDRNGQLMTDCAVNGGNSGGPIFNAEGQVIGTIVSRGLTNDGSDAEGMNYAIPAPQVKDFLARNGYRV